VPPGTGPGGAVAAGVLALPDTDPEGLVETVVRLDAQVGGEHVTRTRWRRASRGQTRWQLVDVHADGAWRSESWCLHPRARVLEEAGVRLEPVAVGTGTRYGWQVIARVTGVAAHGVRVRWRAQPLAGPARATVLLAGQSLLVCQLATPGTNPAAGVDVASGSRWRRSSWQSVTSPVTLPPGHPREGWCELPDPHPVPPPPADYRVIR
jgi:hypothetical protein